MESLGEIIKRKGIPTGTPKDDTDTSLGAEEAEETASEECPLCHDTGWVLAQVPLDHPDYGKAVPCHCAQRELEQDRLARLYRYSNLGPLTRLTFDNLIPEGRSTDPQRQCLFMEAHAAATSYAEDPQGWLVFTGPSGSGKTHLAAAIANHCLGQGRPAFFIMVADLLDHLRSTFAPSSDTSYDELFEQVKKTPLLILDDLGSQSSSPWAMEKLYQILNHRFNAQLPTVIVLDVPLKELDENLSTRLRDPAISRVYPLEDSLPAFLKSLNSLDLPLIASMTFEKFDPKGLNIAGEERQNLKEAYRLAVEYAESPDGWLVFLGDYGCGKTHLAASIAHYCKNQGEEVLFVLVPDLLDYLRSTFSPESRVTYDELFEKVKTVPLLILDDFGEQMSTPWAQAKLYQVINYRYNCRLSTVITSSLTLDEMEGRISSRLADPRVGTVFNIVASDYRSGVSSSRQGKRESPRDRGHSRGSKR